MLHFRCKDLQWLRTKLQTHVEEHIQWILPEIRTARAHSNRVEFGATEDDYM